MGSPTERNLEEELKKLIIEVCDLQEASPDELGLHDALIGPDSPWGLDSLDAVEIIMAVQQHYPVHIDSQNTGQQVLQNLQTLIQFIEEQAQTS
jgi:acyl carrier protein